MQLVNRFLTRIAQATMILALTAGIPQAFCATELVGTDVNSGKLLYIVTPKTVVTISNTGAKPDGIILGPHQTIIYTLSGAGEVHSFDPYTHVDSTLAKGLSSPVNVVLEPGCKSILVSDIGVNKIFRITLANKALTTLYNGTDEMKGLVYNPSGQLFASDDTLQAVVQLNATTGAIISQTPSNMPLIALDGITYDAHTQKLFATSTSAQVVYNISTDLLTVSTISFPSVPVLEGIVSDGGGNLYVVGGDGTTNTIFKYAIIAGTQTTLNTIPGLDDIAIIPFGPCLKVRGTEAVCEEMPDDEENPPATLSK
jgi:sugar lactone lactonase YvrE